jgi:hypothetical protein
MNLLISIGHIVGATCLEFSSLLPHMCLRKLLANISKALEHPSMLEDPFSLWLLELGFPLTTYIGVEQLSTIENV